MKQKHLLFDSSALISLSITCSLPLLEKLKKDYDGKFIIPTAIKHEVVDRAMQIKRFKYAGHQIKKLIDTGTIEVIDETPYQTDIQRLGELANSTFLSRDKAIKIIHQGELALLTIAHQGSGDDAIVIDERTTRLLVETPEQIPELLGAKLHTHISIDQSKLSQLRKELTSIAILRSADLCLAAHLKGYIDSNKDIFESLLWAIKFAGCAISGKEIKEYLTYVR